MPEASFTEVGTWSIDIWQVALGSEIDKSLSDTLEQIAFARTGRTFENDDFSVL
jgi:hypothetical protein